MSGHWHWQICGAAAAVYLWGDGGGGALVVKGHRQRRRRCCQLRYFVWLALLGSTQVAQLVLLLEDADSGIKCTDTFYLPNVLIHF